MDQLCIEHVYQWAYTCLLKKNREAEDSTERFEFPKGPCVPNIRNIFPHTPKLLPILPKTAPDNRLCS